MKTFRNIFLFFERAKENTKTTKVRRGEKQKGNFEWNGPFRYNRADYDRCPRMRGRTARRPGKVDLDQILTCEAG